MGSLFQGTPQTATSHTTSSTETPKWMQDAIFNQINWAQNIANKPYEKYTLPTVAELSPLQQQAYQQVQANQGFYQDAMDRAQTGMEGFGSKGTAEGLKSDQAGFLRPELVDINLGKGQAYWDKAGSIDISGAADPALSKAMGIDAVAAAQPFLNRAGAQDVVGSAQPYLRGAAAQDIVGSARPYMSQAGLATGQSLSERALSAANPYLRASAESTANRVSDYMSPYQQGVLDVIARQGARNLSENLLPQVSESFIKAGQFGSRRMGEFGSRAVRDTQEAILNAQTQAAQQGYGQALGAAQADLARQAQLAGTAGQISGADLSRILQGGAQFGNLAQTAGQLTGQQAQMLANIGQTQGQLTGQQAQILANLGQTTGQLSSQQMQNLANIGQTKGQLAAQQMSQLANLGQMQTQAGQTQQQFGLGAAQATQAAQAQDYSRQMTALQQAANMQQQEQAMRAADVAALEGAGRAQQEQQQAQLNAAQQQFQAEQLYPKQQMDWLSTQIRGLAPITPQITTQSGTTTGATYSPSPLSQLATGLYTYKGLSSLG
jgi:hypothetical protein